MTKEVSIHPTAIIAKGAEIGVGVQIGAGAVIGSSARIGDHSKIGPYVVVDGRTTIGARNQISSFASIGSKPQDLKYRDEDTELVIGDDNLIREYCNISLGTVTGTGKTIIGSNNLLMVYTHVAHDCELGNHIIIANSVALAGHVTLGDRAVVGGIAAVHQFCKIGEMAMLAGGAMVAQDVPPFCMVHGNRATINGLNVVGLRRAGISQEEFSGLKNMYRLVFNENLTVEDAAKKIESEVSDSHYKKVFLSFITKSERGLCR